MNMKPTICKKLSIVLLLLAPLYVAGCDGQTPPRQEQPHGHEHAQNSAGHGDDEAGSQEHGEHKGHDEHDQAIVKLTLAQQEEFDIKLDVARKGVLAQTLDLPGEVALNPASVAHVIPQVPGIVRKVEAAIGDEVQAGDLLAVLDSRQLARAKSTYFAALAKEQLARANFKREQHLFQQKITPKVEFLQAKQAARGAQIDLNLARRNLQALGLSKQQIENLPKQPEQILTRYQLKAPAGGTIIKRHLTRGEVLLAQPEEPPFLIADLKNVWVKLTVYLENLDDIQVGQKVVIAAGNDRLKASGTIDYISPIIGQDTRAATARVVLENSKGQWKPGLFVTGQVATNTWRGEIVVPQSALQTIDKQTVVFVKTGEGFVLRTVKVAHAGKQRVQIVSGLQPGEKYVAQGAFVLKAELLKETFAGHHH